MEMVSKTKLIERLSRKGFGLASIVEAIFQRIPVKASGEVQAATAVNSAFCLRGFLAARQAMPEVEIQKAMAILSSRHQSGKSGGPH